MCSLNDFEDLMLDEEHRNILKGELDWWHKAYLPAGKTVLDIGAGNGETAVFYLNHGAEHVICIEPQADLLYRNLGKDPRVTIIPYSVDKIKSDCEGGERNMVIETHFPFFLQHVKSSPMLDRTTVCWRLKEMNRSEKWMSMIPRHILNLHLIRIQTAHFIRKTLDGWF